MSNSVLLVQIPEAEPVVGQHRLRLDPVTEHGVPAHVTALFPFVPRGLLDDGVVARVAEVATRPSAFDYRLSRTLWFENSALCLDVDDPAPFSAAGSPRPGCEPAAGLKATFGQRLQDSRHISCGL